MIPDNSFFTKLGQAYNTTHDIVRPVFPLAALVTAGYVALPAISALGRALANTCSSKLFLASAAIALLGMERSDRTRISDLADKTGQLFRKVANAVYAVGSLYSSRIPSFEFFSFHNHPPENPGGRADAPPPSDQ